MSDVPSCSVRRAYAVGSRLPSRDASAPQRGWYAWEMVSSVYRERPAEPESALACLWTQSPPADAGPYVQRVVPDGCMDVIWSRRTGALVVAGPDTGPHLATMPPGDQV